MDVRLTAEDGYQAQRSYSIASTPGDERLELTVERIDDGEVSPYLTEDTRPGDQFELRGPVGGYFVWRPGRDEPLLLVGGGSGLVPLMAMLRHRRIAGGAPDARLLLVTRGSRGMALLERDGGTTFIPIFGTDEIADVTGAGDTVISAFTLGLAAGASALDAATLANIGGGLVVMKRGTATVSPAELLQALDADGAA